MGLAAKSVPKKAELGQTGIQLGGEGAGGAQAACQIPLHVGQKKDRHTPGRKPLRQHLQVTVLPVPVAPVMGPW